MVCLETQPPRKLLLHRCHVNEHNLYNQIGLLAVRAIGTGPGATMTAPESLPLNVQAEAPPPEEPAAHQARGAALDPAVVSMVRELEEQLKDRADRALGDDTE